MNIPDKFTIDRSKWIRNAFKRPDGCMCAMGFLYEASGGERMFYGPNYLALYIQTLENRVTNHQMIYYVEFVGEYRDEP